jgi:general secretion pathway protein J
MRHDDRMIYSGFTLIELLVALLIFAIISTISYRVISALLVTKQVVMRSQDKWGNLAQAVNKIASMIDMAIPLIVRDENDNVLPAVIGKTSLSGYFDSQLELTACGFIGDDIYGSVPPMREGIRFDNGTLYLVTWPVLNRVYNTVPRVDVLLNHVRSFAVYYWYPDGKWRDTWPLDVLHYNLLPHGIKIVIVLDSGEVITRIFDSRH